MAKALSVQLGDVSLNPSNLCKSRAQQSTSVTPTLLQSCQVGTGRAPETHDTRVNQPGSRHNRDQQKRRPVSNKVDRQDWHPRRPSDLHRHALAHKGSFLKFPFRILLEQEECWHFL